MGGVDKGDVTLTNYGVIKPLNSDGKKYHFGKTNLTLQTSLMKISENANTFNAFSGTAGDDSHLVLKDSKSVKFADSAKLILEFGENFEFGAGYLFSKLVVDTSGNNALSVDFSRLIPKNDIYTLYKQGDYFIARLQPQHSAISNIYKSNIRTMNNFHTISNSMIYSRKLYHSQNLGNKNQNNLVILRERSDRRISKNNIIDSSPKAQNDNIMLDSALSLKSYESFAYRNEAINRRIQRQNKRNYSRKSQNQTQNLKETQRDLQNLNVDSANKTNQTNPSLRDSAKQNRGNPHNSQTPHDYYFILTPFINHNHFFESGKYNLSGFDYGFLTAFSTKVAESNSLGAHFIFSYGSLGNKKDKDLSIKSLNLNLGINYKLDLIYDMYLKARGDFFYFLNQVQNLSMPKALKPNNLGFGVSVAYGKEWDFRDGGMLGIEVALDYKALQVNNIKINNNANKTISETYQKKLYNLIYVDLGLIYAKYFNTHIGLWGINTTLGIKGNITANKLSTSNIHINNLNRDIDMVLDNDKYLGYANAGISYMLNTKNFDMEFSLAYYGNYGDRVISNGGGVEWRVIW